MKLLGQTGFSILQGLLLAGLLSGTALVTSQLISSQKKAAISVKSKDSVDELAEQVYNLLQFQDNCTQTLWVNSATNLTGEANINNIIVVNRGTTDGLNSSQNVFTAGRSYYGNSISIDSMIITFGSINNLAPATLDIRLKRNDSTNTNAALRTKDGYGTQDFSKKISIVIQRDSSNNFQSCYAVKTNDPLTAESGNINLMREFCIELGPMFTWNSTRNVCLMNSVTCPAGQFYVGVNSAGRVCRPPSTAINADQYVAPDHLYPNCFNRIGVRLVPLANNKVGITCQ